MIINLVAFIFCLFGMWLEARWFMNGVRKGYHVSHQYIQGGLFLLITLIGVVNLVAYLKG